ncbi:hypothetical protein G7046_g9835 [Stylonectria norvegica]|nr:hypothetical protein G7046_g9835 [Stylonectria norvegica]
MATSQKRRRAPNNFTPAFWDNLSKVGLTPRALRELDRRNTTQSVTKSPISGGVVVTCTDLARFARRGGPDLGHLRGSLQPRRVAKTMASNHVSVAIQSRETVSKKATSNILKLKRSSAYDDNFEQHLLDHNIYPEGYYFADGRPAPEPSNIDRFRQEILIAGVSLSSSLISESVFWDFKKKSKTKSEGTLMRTVIPILMGISDIPNEGHLPFTNFISITDEATVKAIPDFFDGAHPRSINKDVSNTLGRYIIPTNHATVPVLPNFFLEAKAPKGGSDVALRQACIDGACGARAMHQLQNYGATEIIYDGNAYTYSFTYHYGTLRLYTHHIRAPAMTEEPEYYMTQIATWGMTDNIDACRHGLAAFRETRELAQRQRDSFIQTANARASQDSVQAHLIKMPQHEQPNFNGALRDASEPLQQTAGTSDTVQDENETLLIAPYVYAEGGSLGPDQLSTASELDGPSMSPVLGLKSRLSGDTNSSKRKHTQLSLSPPSESTEHHRSKCRTRPSMTARAIDSPTRASAIGLPSPNNA